MLNKTVKDVMNADVLSVPEGMTVEDLAAFFEDNEVSGAPVVDDGGRLVGVVSLKNLVHSLAGSRNAAPDRSDPSYFVREWEDHFNPEELQRLRVVDTEVTVGDFMSRQIHTVTEDTGVRSCARKMLELGVHRLLVTDGDQLRGIVTSFDLLQLVAE
ncbi:MAG TPA: CBS domain-containing protein [Thermoanaerobaculia bacterium]|jgi:CBS domain-containing protein